MKFTPLPSAYVTFGDFNEERGKALAKELGSYIP
jgi:hypothetical protein